MKNLLIILCCFLLTSCDFRTNKIDKTESKADTILTYYNSGILRSIEIWQDSVRNGPAVYYYDNGLMEAQFHFENGIKKDSFKTFHYNGSLRSVGFLLNDTTPHGVVKIYESNGNLFREIVYENGIELN